MSDIALVLGIGLGSIIGAIVYCAVHIERVIIAVGAVLADEIQKGKP